MKLVLRDSLSLPGIEGKANEDAWAHRESAAVVLDGATGLGERLMPGPSDAAWLSRFAANRLMAYTTEGAAIHEAVAAALFDAQTSFEQMQRRAPRERYEIPYASLMLALAEPGGLEFAWYGDCVALVAAPGRPVEIVGDAPARRRNEADRVRALAERIGESAAAASPRESFLPALRQARNTVNTPKGGYLFGPDVTAADHLRVARVEASSGTRILLATDGFLALATDYAAYDFSSLLFAADGKGLAELARELRTIEEADPQGQKFSRFKTSDDATAVLLGLE